MVKQKLNLCTISIIILLLLLGCSGSTEYILKTEIVVLASSDSLKANIKFPDISYRLEVDTHTVRISLVDSSIIYPIYEGYDIADDGDTLLWYAFHMNGEYLEYEYKDTLYKIDTLTIDQPYIPADAKGIEIFLWIGLFLVGTYATWRIRREKKKNV